jgi:glyoxylase-like metal-dependent hydrolase (beta-lactamase superfamily II)
VTELDVRGLTVGPVQENTYIVRAAVNATHAILVDPGDEPERIEAALEELGITEVDAILLTHCHFDHIGAVAPMARKTGAPVYCPAGELQLLTESARFTPPGFGPFESYEPEQTLSGGEHLSLAGIELDVLSTPGHSPGHLTYAASGALFSGDVLFQGSVGRVDLPGGNWATLRDSIATLVDGYPADTMVFPGHMGVTTLGRELASNPFLEEIRERRLPARP